MIRLDHPIPHRARHRRPRTSPGALPRSRAAGWVAVAAAFLGLAPGILAQAPSSETMVLPGARWDILEPDQRTAMGWRPLRPVFEFVRDSMNTTGLVVVDRGRVAFEFGDVEELSYLASVRKSILAILYGPFVEDGTIDLDATLAELGVDDVGGLLEIEREATVRDLVTARSGIYHAASNGGDDLANAPERGSRTPGEYMLYNNWDFNAAGAVFEQLTGRNIYDELERQLAVPLGFQDWERDAQRKSGDLSVSRNPAYHMWISTRDMARVGLLMLKEGRWGDRQVISPEWARTISGVVTPLEEMNPVSRRDGYFGYGYMWWVFDGPAATGPFAGAYTARGAWGQWITVFPALELVVAHKTNSVYRRTTSWESWHRMLELLLEARGVAPEDPWPWGSDR